LSIAFTNAANIFICRRSLFLDNVTVVAGDVTPPSSTVQPTGVPGNWTIKLDEEFNDASLNPRYWATSWYNGVNKVSLSEANVAVANGNLALTLSSSKVGAAAVTGPVTSTFGFKLGAPCVWEARINFPADASGNYLNWPAFWLLDDSRDGASVEIDVAEVWNGTVQTAYHVNGSNSPAHAYPFLGSGYHIWTLNRTTTGKDYVYIDGVLQYTLTTTSGDTGLPQYVLFNIGTQGSHQQVPSTLYVDYVRAWTPA
jgi:Glycosyl hydrolases family 16